MKTGSMKWRCAWDEAIFRYQKDPKDKKDIKDRTGRAGGLEMAPGTFKKLRGRGFFLGKGFCAAFYFFFPFFRKTYRPKACRVTPPRVPKIRSHPAMSSNWKRSRPGM